MDKHDVKLHSEHQFNDHHSTYILRDYSQNAHVDEKFIKECRICRGTIL